MIIKELVQGTPEWNEHRSNADNASEAPAMKGVSPYMSRGELLRLKQSGNEKDFSDYVQKRVLNRGHEIEDFAREEVEEGHEIDLYPVTVCEDEGRLSASLDGLTLDWSVTWECKSLNKEKKELFDQGQVHPADYIQIQQGLLITKAKKCLYTISDGTENNTFTMEVLPDSDCWESIREGWAQFAKDLKDYQAPQVDMKSIGTAIETLPYLNIQLDAKVIASNIDEFKAHALEVFDGISTELQTDQDFADAEQAVKFCQSVEDRLKSTKDSVLAQAEDLYRTLTAMDDVSGASRTKRLALGSLIKHRKEERKAEIQQQAVDNMAEHVATINKSFDGQYHIEPPSDFRVQIGQGMKGRRTILTWIDAADQVLADAKIAINQRADLVRVNLVEFKNNAENHRHLFADWKDLIEKPTDDFVNVIKIRIAEHEKAEQDRLEAERQRIRAEEQANARLEEERRAQAAKDEEQPSTKPLKKAGFIETQPAPRPAMTEPPQVMLTEYQRGYINGLMAFAWWKDGLEQVGIAGTPLKKAIADFIKNTEKDESE